MRSAKMVTTINSSRAKAWLLIMETGARISRRWEETVHNWTFIRVACMQINLAFILLQHQNQHHFHQHRQQFHPRQHPPRQRQQQQQQQKQFHQQPLTPKEKHVIRRKQTCFRVYRRVVKSWQQLPNSRKNVRNLERTVKTIQT